MSKQQTIEQKYRRLSDVEHCLLRPGRYIGSVKPKTSISWLMGSEKMEQREVTWNPGFIKLFDEIISNSVDFSKTPEGKHLDTIRVEVDCQTGIIAVMDNGGIPVELHTEYDEYIPSLIFGYLRSGSNFGNDDDSDLTGQNGEGASLTNIFSTKFTVETCDGKKKFKQTWTKNMMEKTAPQIIETDAKGFTKITYTPDYAHLNTTLDDGNYAKIVKRVYDVAGCNPKLKVYLNGERIKINSFKDYVSMFVDVFEYDENADWQVAVSKSDEGFQHVSFVNSTETIQGGTHVAYVIYQIANRLREYFKKKHKVDVKPTDIFNHMQLFVNARIIKPRYDSQTKENLMTEPKEYKTSWEPDEKFIQRIIKSDIIQKVLDWVAAKEHAAEMAKLRSVNKDSDKLNLRKIVKLQDANLAGKSPEKCILFLTEGDCLEENTLVSVIKDNEVKDARVKDIRPGDLVLTHLNRYKKVTNVAFSVKEMIKIRYEGKELIVSRDHRLLVYSKKTKEIDWKPAHSITDDDCLVKSTIINAMHAEIKSIESKDEKIIIEYNLLGEVDRIISTRSHRFYVFDISDLSYKLIEASELNFDHYLAFRDK